MVEIGREFSRGRRKVRGLFGCVRVSFFKEGGMFVVVFFTDRRSFVIRFVFFRRVGLFFV